MYAIQTKINAHRYRSRLEARYAVLLQMCGLPFQYEREGFELESGRYLPDFWLPTKKWVRFSRQFGGLAKVDRVGVYAASFSVFSVVGSIA